MKTLTLLVELTYDDEVIHGGDSDLESRGWFYDEVLFGASGELILHSNLLGDEIGGVKVLNAGPIMEAKQHADRDARIS